MSSPTPPHPPSEQLAIAHQEFTPLLAISKFPYRFVGKEHSEPVAAKFFNAGKFFEREWNLYQVWPPSELSQDPLILVTAEQFRQLLDEINMAFQDVNLDLHVSDHYRDIGMVFTLPERPSMAPQYLGQSQSKGQYEELVQKGSNRRYSIKTEPMTSDDRSFEAFQTMMEKAIDQTRRKNNAQKAKKKEERLLKQRGMKRQLKRAQTYLGLRPKLDHVIDPRSQDDWSKQSSTQQEAKMQDFRALASVPAIDVKSKAEYAFDNSVIFVAFDLEAWEMDHSIVTEVGLSFLDTEDIKHTAPSKDGANWVAKIKSFHYRVAERTGYQNGEFVAACADRFEFGKSELIKVADIPHMLASCFTPPFLPRDSNVAEDLSKLSIKEDEATEQTQSAEPQVSRRIVLVGHDINQDIKYLQKLGYNPLDSPHVIEKLDTAELYKAWKQDVQARSLGIILYELGQTAWNLHNAGNDARYTLNAMLGIAVRDAELRGTAQLSEMREQERAERLQKASSEAAGRAVEEAEGWMASE